jgi:outer membrane protein OmpA-like peptidoglycan-associated protein
MPGLNRFLSYAANGSTRLNSSKMKRFLIIFAFLLIYPTYKVVGQQADAALKEVFKDAEFFFTDESYPDALAEYIKLYKRGFNNANINYKMGVCYLKISGQKEKSISYLETAVKDVSAVYKESSLSEKHAPFDAYLFLGNAYRVNNDLDKAIAAYTKYKELKVKGNAEDLKYADQQIDACKTAEEFMKNPVPFKIENLGRHINNINSNYRPAVSGDGKTLAYVTKQKFYDAVIIARFEKGSWKEGLNITQQIQSDGNQYPSSLSYDGKTLYLTKEDNFNSDIYFSEFANGQWTVSKPLNKNINTRYWESFASVTADGKTLYFASNRKDGIGNMDIYVSVKEANGQWGPAKNVGNKINTSLSEDCPIISPDGNTLFFSSQGHRNMGGYDIFYSKKINDKEWSEPVNMGYPINTTDDDLYFAPIGDGSYAYIARLEKGGFGSEDIYQIELKPEAQKELEVLKKDTITGPKVKEIDETKLAEKKDTTRKIKEIPVVNKEQTKEIKITGILFGFNSYQLNSEAIKHLEILANALSTYPEVVLEIEGHADGKGTGNANMAITQKRAEAVAKYLASKGIKEHRLKPVAKGKAIPIAINSNPDGSDNPDGRKLNRRAEFKASGKGSQFIIFEKIKVPDQLKIK